MKADPDAILHCAQELGLTRTADGFDAQGTCCQNTWAVYRDMRMSARARSASLANAAGSDELKTCRFGAPLIASALQRLGALDAQADPARVTPAALPQLALQEPALFGRPVTIRGLSKS